MSLYYQDDAVTLYHGDCVEVMRTLPAESVDAIITSPPYAEQRQSTYGGIKESDYPAWTVTWMAEVWRVLKPNGSALINISPHVKNGQLSDYVLRTRLALRASGWNEVDELIWHKTNAMPVGHKDRPKRSWESILWYSKHGRPFSDAKANGRPSTRDTAVTLYGQHTNREDWDHFRGGSGNSGGGGSTPTVVRCSNVASFAKGNATTGHPAAFPIALAEWMGKLITPESGTILDPFSGSGTTGLAALRNGWNYIGIDIVREYIDITHKRLEGEAA